MREMIGSPGIAAWIAQAAFLTLIIWGWASGEVGWKGGVAFLLLAGVAFISRPYVPYGVGLFPPYLAVLDIALVFKIFKGDVRIG